MIPFDTKHYRANQPGCLRKYWPHILTTIALIALLSWLDKLDRDSHLNRVQQAASGQCK
ncbi:hypothetical protein SAMN06296273_1197 [Nitrosomonas ureae]|jgi:hypothetical protein|uniref:Uncharacterized protein n=1 Tax=Nitrosomonas ureae TaxID=44577 RepID=A0A285BY60_9PROT|nr:hypothetical protein [Nitrosomonas sp.]SNX59763.1 hypothetical protein SAMN06296273_1197 [Nitrosomonas ureae]